MAGKNRGSGANKLALLVIIMALCLLATLLAEFYLHTDAAYTHLFYIPIFVAGLWYNKKAVGVALFLGLIHIAANYYSVGHLSLAPWLRTLIFCAVAFMIGNLSEKKEKVFRETIEHKQAEVTERTRTEEALRTLHESETRYKIIYETSADAITLTAPEKGFFAGNPAAIKMFECRDEKEFISHSPADFSPEYQPDGKLSSAKVREVEAAALKEGSHFFEWKHRTNKGREFFATVLLTRLELQNKKFLQSTVRDITKDKQAEETLRESEERFRSLFDNSNDGIIAADAVTTKFLLGNQTIHRMLGYTPEELTTLQVKDIHPQKDFPTAMEAFNKLLRKEINVAPGFPVQRKDGSIFYADITAHPLNLWGKACLVGVFRDVTERKQAEEKLKHYAADLKRANEEVREFAYIVSHDLRTPLVNIKGFAAELRSTLKTVDSALNGALPHLDQKEKQEVTDAFRRDIPEALNFIDSSATHMDGFINSLLKLSRMGRREMTFEPINLAEIVETTLKGLAHQIKEHRAKITAGPLPEVIGDRTAIEQIVENILSDAVKYLDPDRPGEIEITGERNEEKTILVIRDNGRGIAKEDMPRVFMPFRRFGRQDTKGEGMGLAFAHTLARRHGGNIRCESESGAGTTFTVTLSNHPEQGG
jgi:PAS domain S-box-containing protein